MNVKDLTGRAQVIGQLCQRAYVGDAGFDLFVQGRPGEVDPYGKPCHWIIRSGEFVDLPLGCAVELPVGYWGLLIGRSSTLRQRRLMVAQGIIDHGYRGPLFTGVWNLGETTALVEPGAKIAQLIPIPLYTGHAVLVDELNRSERGEQGFGSSGR